MCDNCVEKRGDFSRYQTKTFPYNPRSYFLIEIENWHDTGKRAMCPCNCIAFYGESVGKANSASGGKWIVQCVGCKRIYFLPLDKWEMVEIVVGRSDKDPT